MIFWLILAGLTLATLAFVTLPFLTRPQDERRDDDVAVYRDQLAEIDRDLQAGRIGQEESEAARIEVSRRLLKAAEAAAQTPASDSGAARKGRRAGAIAFALIAIPAISVAFYYRLGAPWEAFPRPVAASDQKGPGGLSINEMIARVEARARENPGDGRAYDVLAPVYMRLGRFDDAIAAWRKAME
ncbi:MAG: c-type cytochrome biogenesis protein CcmI [Rhodoblastus sp.]